jgi:rhodanese-related sulfurtransferase
LDTTSGYHQDKARECRELDPDECYSRIKAKDNTRCVLIDVRTSREFHESRIPGAINIDFFSPSFRDQIKSRNPDNSYIVYCQKGTRGKKCMEFMKESGFTEVYNIAGGILGWIASGLPTEH